MSRPCDHCFHSVYSYLDHEISWFEAWRIRRHLRTCGGCESAYVFEEKLLLMVKTRLREDLPPEFLERLRRALSDET
ncbi:MAG: zf-HC2 domain-containing protein [Acidimicrobiia bacterium]